VLSSQEPSYSLISSRYRSYSRSLQRAMPPCSKVAGVAVAVLRIFEPPALTEPPAAHAHLLVDRNRLEEPNPDVPLR
jgi:hypothetical protein